MAQIYIPDDQTDLITAYEDGNRYKQVRLILEQLIDERCDELGGHTRQDVTFNQLCTALDIVKSTEWLLLNPIDDGSEEVPLS